MITLKNIQTNEIATYSDRWGNLALNSGNFIEVVIKNSTFVK